MAISNPANQFGNSQFVVDPIAGRGSFTTINAALAASSSGDSIIIRPGTYTENLTANMGGKSLIASSVGTNAFEVVVVGNHSFTENAATVGFQGIDFSASAGVCFTVGSSGAGSSSAFFEGCRIRNSAGTALQTTSAGGTGDVTTFFTRVDGSTVGANLANGSVRMEGGTVIGGTSNAVQIGASCTVTATNMDNMGSSSDAVLISSATAVLRSKLSKYTCSGSAFRYTANGSVRTLQDEIESSDAAGQWASSSGAFGQLSYADAVLLGTADEIDPQISATALPVAGGGAVVWSSIGANQTLDPNQGYFVTAGTLSLALPIMSGVGDVVHVIRKGGGAFTITQAAGQSVQIGNVTSTVGVGGSVVSTASGDALVLRCSTANLAWVCESSIGNFTIV